MPKNVMIKISKFLFVGGLGVTVRDEESAAAGERNCTQGSPAAGGLWQRRQNHTSGNSICMIINFVACMLVRV